MSVEGSHRGHHSGDPRADDRRLASRAECPQLGLLGQLRLGPRLGPCKPDEGRFVASQRGVSEEQEAVEERAPGQPALPDGAGLQGAQ
jgi:hypothetical protein